MRTPPGISPPVLLSITLMLAGGVPAHGADWYVAPTGSDGAAGTSLAPFQTPQHAANVAVAGDTVHVAAGSYAGFSIATSGAAAARLTFLASPGATIVSPWNSGGTLFGINSYGGQYITIDGFTIAPTPGTPFWSYGISFKSGPGSPAATWYYGNIVRNCTVSMRWGGVPDPVNDPSGTKTADGLGIFSSFQDGIQVLNNNVSGTYDNCIYTSNSARNYLVHGNTCHDFGGMGTHNNGDASQGTGYPGINFNALIDGNTFYDCTLSGLGQVISCDGVQNSVISNNLVIGAASKGISLFDVDAADGCHHDVVTCNTVTTAATGGAALRIADNSSGNIVFDNILECGNASQGAVDLESGDLVGFSCDHNAVTTRFFVDDSPISLTAWQAQGYDVHSLVATASQLFVNAAGRDYRLSSTSPAIGAGVGSLSGTSAPAADLVGDARPSASGWDLGAYAAGAGSTTGTATTGVSGTTGASATTGASGTGTGTGTATASASTTAAGTATAASGASGGTASSGGLPVQSGGGGGAGCGVGGAVGLLALAAACCRARRTGSGW